MGGNRLDRISLTKSTNDQENNNSDHWEEDQYSSCYNILSKMSSCQQKIKIHTITI